MTQATWPESAVDLARWPIDDLGGGRGRRLLKDVRAEVARLGACTLEGFLRPAAWPRRRRRSPTGLITTRVAARPTSSSRATSGD